MKKIILVFLMLFTIHFRSYGQNDTWSWGVEKFTPEEQQEYDEKYDAIRTGNNGSATDTRYCHLEGSINDIIEFMNTIGELLSYGGYSTGLKIDADKCTFEITDYKKGLYYCPVNASTSLALFTDKYLNPETLQIFGPAVDDTPKQTTWEWAYVAASLACKNYYMNEIDEMYMETFRNGGFYENAGIEFYCGMDPYMDDTWIFIIQNK